MIRFFDKNKIILCYQNDDKDNTAYDVISKYAELTNKKILYNKEKNSLTNNNIIISKNFDVDEYKKYDVKIFIIADLNQYMIYLKNKNIDIDLIFFPHRINFGFMKIIYDDYLLNNQMNTSFINFLNDCCHNIKNEYILIHTKYKSYFRYGFYDGV